MGEAQALMWLTPQAALDPARPVFVEAESKKVGNLAVPESLIEAVHRDQCFNAGNRVVRHYADQPPEVLLTG